MIENEWRLEYCAEGYEMVYCTCPWDVPVCYGYWTCEDIYNITEETFANYDVNGDG